MIGSIVALACRRLRPEHRHRVRIDGFEAAYERLKSLADRTLTLRLGGRDFHLLEPPSEAARPARAEAVAVGVGSTAN